MSDISAQPTDGRAARSYRARLAVADALLDLVTEGVEKPTAAQIAERAGVSLRLVFHHFEDLESIYAAAADRQLERLRSMIKEIDPQLPFEKRLALFVRNRAKIFEYVSPVRRASLRLEPSSPEVKRRMRHAYEIARDQAFRAFSSEIAAFAPNESADTTSALDAASSWEMWDFLRRRAGLSERQASRVLERAIRALLGH